MTKGTRRFDPETAEQRVQRPLHVAQPESTAALRPSQRRAADNRASMTGHARSIEACVRDFGALTGADSPTPDADTAGPGAANRGQVAGKVFGVVPGPPVVERVLEVAAVADHLTYSPANGSGAAVRTPAD